MKKTVSIDAVDLIRLKHAYDNGTYPELESAVGEFLEQYKDEIPDVPYVEWCEQWLMEHNCDGCEFGGRCSFRYSIV